MAYSVNLNNTVTRFTIIYIYIYIPFTLSKTFFSFHALICIHFQTNTLFFGCPEKLESVDREVATLFLEVGSPQWTQSTAISIF